MRPPWFIIGRTARAPCLRGPVSSTLGCTARRRRVHCNCQAFTNRHRLHLRCSGSHPCRGPLGGARSQVARAPQRFAGGAPGTRARSLKVSFTVAPPAEGPACLANAVQAALEDKAFAPPSTAQCSAPPGQGQCSSGTSSPAQAAGRSLTGRSTGAPTAWHLARAALAVYHAPHGPGAIPSSPG